ncbi:hypothetical protein UJ101_01326 [Flavobacteriaceae bacterium UJ101]|nr:hypothetical protein UJ101_01326 [Flavobacteriaceae bacterium UJ101]
MNSKTLKTIYWVSTGLLSLLMLFSAIMYFAKNDMVQESFIKLGYPTYIIYPLAIAKILAIITLLSKKTGTLKEWVYAGLFFDLVLALSAHIMVNDGEFLPAAIGLILLALSYSFNKQLFKI